MKRRLAAMLLATTPAGRWQRPPLLPGGAAALVQANAAGALHGARVARARTQPSIVTPALTSAAKAVQSSMRAATASAHETELCNFAIAKTAADLERHQADTSPWALAPEKWGFLKSVLGSANSARAMRHAPGTRKQDKSN
jgi:hypothetical protein